MYTIQIGTNGHSRLSFFLPKLLHTLSRTMSRCILWMQVLQDETPLKASLTCTVRDPPCTGGLQLTAWTERRHTYFNVIPATDTKESMFGTISKCFLDCHGTSSTVYGTIKPGTSSTVYGTIKPGTSSTVFAKTARLSDKSDFQSVLRKISVCPTNVL